MSKISDKIKFIDMFGNGVNLLVSNNIKHRTIFGSLLSLLSSAVIILSVYLIGRTIFEKTKPTLLMFTQKLRNRPNMTLNTNSSIFAVRMEDTYGNIFDDERAFTIRAGQENYTRNPNTSDSYNGWILDEATNYEIPLVKCDMNTH